MTTPHSSLPAIPARPQDGGTIDAADWQAVRAAEPVAALRWVRTAAQRGHAEAQAVLGQWLLDGHGAARDADEALHWFRCAAELGHAMAMNMAGRCHEQGWGTEADAAKASAWYRRAAALGLPEAQYNLANLLASGHGVARDHAAAYALYRQAADQGYAKAWAKLGRYHEDGLVVPQDAALAFECFRRGAEGGDFRGQFCHAGALAAAGRVDEALQWLAKVQATATPRYLREAGTALAQSPHPRVRDIGAAMRARSETAVAAVAAAAR